ncbi:hypothetical protein SAMN06295879_3717 [Agreia bicolorata]|uniref:Uncharacterized protein n=1 Tax=Agreia bicolorata TaxID=110935 RepID=A0A1T4YNQ2_9MICO|nr:hypothetical protein [Agreia bicolorata]KJC63041.1 hypothetical protein TZ00_16780 [Agreia bicolorata]SKB03392.1 hypothetical protein SAMN06295879_3717 [Agreia bicolorata]
MNIVDSDERDSTWEQHSSLFRVYFATVPDAAVRTVDVSDATFTETFAWARGEADAGETIAVALVGIDNRGLRGLTWLFGADPNDSSESGLHTRMLAEMYQEHRDRV